MKIRHLLLIGLLALPLGCEETPVPNTPANPPEPTPPAAETAKPADPSAEELAKKAEEEKKKAEEEKKKAEALKKLEADWAQLEEDTKAEDARWNPKLHAEVKRLAARYGSIDAAMKATIKGKHRKPQSAGRDKYRHPAETLKFFGLKPTMQVLEYSPGEGWWTELLGPTLAVQGKLYVNIGDAKGPRDQRGTYYAERLRRFLDRAPELYGKIERIQTTTPVPSFGIEGKLDMVIVARSLHGMHRNKVLGGFLKEVHKALKPGGVLGVEQHRAAEGANPDESAKKGYLPEAWVIKTIEEAGFKLEAKSEVNRNAKDTKDYPEGVWALPPTLERKDKDREQLLAIGESDRMTLRFTKK